MNDLASLEKVQHESDGRLLRFTLVGKDSCSGNDRTVVLSSKRWRKQG